MKTFNAGHVIQIILSAGFGVNLSFNDISGIYTIELILDGETHIDFVNKSFEDVLIEAFSYITEER